MFKLTIEVSSIPELATLVGKLGDHMESAQVEHALTPSVMGVSGGANVAEPTPPAKAAPAKAKARSTKAKAAPVEDEMEDVPSPFNQAIPPVIDESRAPQVAPGVFNKEAAVQRAVALIGEMKKAGVSDADVMPKVHEVYRAAGCDLALRISQFDDVSLSRFMPLFEQKVTEIISATQGKPASFI